jgi:hypothetical protein
VHVAEADVIFLMDVYGKGEQEDLTSDQERILKGLAEVIKRSAIRAARAFREGPPSNRRGTASRCSSG